MHYCLVSWVYFHPESMMQIGLSLREIFSTGMEFWGMWEEALVVLYLGVSCLVELVGHYEMTWGMGKARPPVQRCCRQHIGKNIACFSLSCKYTKISLEFWLGLPHLIKASPGDFLSQWDARWLSQIGPVETSTFAFSSGILGIDADSWRFHNPGRLPILIFMKLELAVF